MTTAATAGGIRATVAPPQADEELGAMRHNNAVGGASNSRHLYGDAADPVGSPSLSRLAQRARHPGVGRFFGPGHADHNDHAHVDGRTNRS
ncbi:D-Ala-D-Ala carboxypeptidase family metallohydrolase [Streptomyces sp. NPDC050433]|uniref:D-Ala-D-Ala carboxypeptidase family metallohydrolase n=1 Tax=unclassified Streptomyces TaxID=2593676 RepID=UPI0034476B5B